MDDQTNPNNDLNAPVTKFCLALEKDRRTPEGRIRSEHDFREHFFPYDESSAKDRILRFLPRDVRGPIIASWGIRGRKAAMRDDDARVRAVVHDAFVAGDIDDPTFEEGVATDVIISWCELADWWKFWRGGKHTEVFDPARSRDRLRPRSVRRQMVFGHSRERRRQAARDRCSGRRDEQDRARRLDQESTNRATDLPGGS